MTPADLDFISGAVVGIGGGITMLRTKITLQNPQTRGKAIAFMIGACALWWLIGELFWR